MRRDDWTTPQKLYDYLNEKWQFTIDAAASDHNAKHKRYWTESDDALKQDWSKEVIFCNPPYSKCMEFSMKGLQTLADSRGSHPPRFCLLLPVRSDRIWYQKLVNDPSIKTCHITGRLHFDDSGKGAFMYSVIVYTRTIGEPLNNYLCASLFNINGKGGAKT